MMVNISQPILCMLKTLNKMKKTIWKWICEWDDPINRVRAKDNILSNSVLIEHSIIAEVKSLPIALSAAFYWHKSTEGKDYWGKVYYDLKNVQKC